MFYKKIQEMLGEIAFEEKAEKWADKMYPCDGQAQRYLLMGAKFGYNEKCSELVNELKWERDTKTELAEHLGKANNKVADLEETINKLREQLALRYDLEDKIKELEETNKVNEWHYVKDGDLPKDDKQYLVLFFYNYKGKKEMSCGVRDNLHSDFEIRRCYTEQIITWQEIVLPELKESE